MPPTADGKGPAPGGGRQLLVALAVNALELGVVIGASYYLSGWLAKRMPGQQLSRPPNEEARRRLERMLTERAEREVASIFWSRATNTYTDEIIAARPEDGGCQPGWWLGCKSTLYNHNKCVIHIYI